MSADHPSPEPERRVRRSNPVLLGTAILAASALATVTVASVVTQQGRQEKDVRAALVRNLPGTAVNAVDCSPEAAPRGLCEFVAGRNVFYATPDGRYVVVGQVLDLKKKVDLTERRSREVGALASAEDAIGGRTPVAGPLAGSQAAGAGGSRPVPPQILKIDLPLENAIVHNRGAKLKVAAFTDFNCHYCRQLFSDLKGVKDIEVTEYPIAFLGADSAAKAKIALCAADRPSVSDQLYGGETPKGGDCADGAKRLQQNLDFAQSHGITGTPTLVRADGATNAGWLPPDKLAAWLSAGRG